ncbi:glutamine amidotransferase-like class 1 domain-containing protein 3, mitochondrial [Nematostella vectensis]|uniref:glutamine amidotransferase-like class 1 domain-containing protein 3, mitochondrial n=1 Tax=Nematostella vectensis TaxID=45351 RepID=UPI0013903676|nr:glutamine amidotransferase-like class 1 domain-containing protein 3, mitochondrial [Nematostella vectensis]
MIAGMMHSTLMLSAISKALLRRGPLFSTSVQHHKSVAVVLSGCGVFDGSEVHEASSILVHLSRAGADVSIYAPDIPQMHVINHAKGQPSEETRNVLHESARIARGKITALSELNSANHDAVVFPGGFGAAKNLSTFATEGADLKVNDQVQKTIQEFHSSKKPIGLCCIAPVIAAKLIPGCEVTVGQDTDDGTGKWPYAGTAEAITKMNSKHINKNVDEIHIDSANKLVTTPAFMCETRLHEIHDGIGKMVEAIMDLAN